MKEYEMIFWIITLIFSVINSGAALIMKNWHSFLGWCVAICGYFLLISNVAK
jgi:hypothetical protein